MSNKHIICYSGGHSSALVAIEVVRKYGKENCILLNHDIASNVEHEDIKRFKREVANYLGMEITYANIRGLEISNIPDQFDVVVQAGAFKVGKGTELCTSRLKTEPFREWLKEFAPPETHPIIYYGFDANEMVRVRRRIGILAEMGYKSDYPLAIWRERTIHDTEEIGINKPLGYTKFKHANCIGCLKAGKLHWYITYLERPDIFEKAKNAEEVIGYTIIKGISMLELEKDFKILKEAGVEASEHEGGATFGARARKVIKVFTQDDIAKPCECTV
jgi:hypothetical protein